MLHEYSYKSSGKHTKLYKAIGFSTLHVLGIDENVILNHNKFFLEDGLNIMV